MVERTLGPDMYLWPIIAGKMATEMAMSTSIAIARMVQIVAQSSDTALTKYIELAELEMRRTQRKESVKVE